MQAILQDRITLDDRGVTAGPAWQPQPLRWRLLAGCVLAVTAVALTVPAPLGVDADLLWLLRGMAALKALMVAGVVALLWWRLQWPMAVLPASAALAGCWALCAATVLIWQMAMVGLAAALFHVALLGLLLLAWRDEGPRRGRPA